MATFLPGVTDVFPGPAPFEPNFQFIDTMLRRRQSMYEQGYSQVSAAYKALNRNLTNPMNAQSRDGFLRQAEANLKDLSAMDLSLPQNVDAATNVFKPFYQNTDILADMSLTAHWDQQESIANMYRTKDGGKEYSEDNINYVRQQRNKYAQDNPANWRGYMQEKRSYTPYYDWNKEFMDYMKVYKPDSISIKRRNGMYNSVEENKGASAEDLKLFFSSVASEKAKEQMRISAMVRIGDNAESVAPYYKQVLEREIKTYDQELNKLDTQIKVAPNKETRDQLTIQRKEIAEAIAERQNHVDKIKSGDVEFMRANAPRIAFALYFDEAVGRLANGLSWKDYKYDFDGDDVAMMYYRNAEDWKRTIYSADRADRRELMKAQLEAATKKKGGGGGDDEEFVGSVDYVNAPSFNNKTNEAITVNTLQQKITKNREDQVAAADMLRKHVATILQKDPSQVTATDVVTYGKSDRGQRDGKYLGFKQKISEIALDNDLVQRSIETAKNKARTKVGEATYNRIESNLRQLDALGKEKGITGEEMYHAVVNGTAKMYTDTPLVYSMNTASPSKPTQKFLEINGRRYAVRPNDKLVQMYNAAKNYSGKSETSEYNKQLNQVIVEESRMINNAMSLDPKDARFKTTQRKLSNLIGVDVSKIPSLLYGGKNDVYFTIEGDDWDAQKERIMNLQQQYGVEIVANDATRQFYLKEKPGVSSVSLGLDIYANFSQHEKMLINMGEMGAQDGYTSPHFSAGNKVVDKYGTPIKQFHYKVSESGGEKYFYLYNDAVPGVPVKEGSSLSDLFVVANSIADNYTMFLQSVKETYGK